MRIFQSNRSLMSTTQNQTHNEATQIKENDIHLLFRSNIHFGLSLRVKQVQQIQDHSQNNAFPLKSPPFIHSNILVQAQQQIQGHHQFQQFIMDSRRRGQSSHQGNANKSFKVGGSLAEENDVRGFNRPRNNKSMAPSQPHRIELPLFFNTPSRFLGEQSALNKTSIDEDRRRCEKIDNATYITVTRRLKDYQMLAFGCRRAGKVRDEGRSYYSIGVLYDNIKKYKKAVEYYLKFLSVCKSINDSHGQALAYNCIGVDYQLLGQADPELTKKAIEYHNLHQNLADINGKFLASINLGLCYDRLGDHKNSIFYFQNALKHSIQMSNLSGQSVAVGNIGRIGTKDLSENKDKMKIFVEKYLKLSSEMRDEKGEMEGCLKLGMISSTKKNFEEGKDNFRRALQLAEQSGDTEVYNQAKFGFAVVAAEKGMNNYLGYFSSKMNRRSDY